MADQGVWFKLHCSALDDPSLDNLSVADFGRWGKFGAFVKRHGTGGSITLSPPARSLCALFQVADFAALEAVLQRFPHVTMRRADLGVSLETSLTVSFDNWLKYQGDFSSPRVRRFREMKRSKRRGEEKRGEEKKKRVSSPPSSPSLANQEPKTWGTPEALVALYNAMAPDECPAVEKLSPARREKARKYLAMFPDQDFWEQAFREIGRSQFLRGLVKREGHTKFVADFDWLLTRGKDQTENVVKVWEGKYRD